MIHGFFALFLGVLLSINTFAAQDPLYDKINEYESIRKADSLFVYKDDYQGAKKYYLKAIKDLDSHEIELLAYCYIKLANVYTSVEEYNPAKLALKTAKKFLNRLDNPNSLIQAEYDLYFGKYLLRGPKKIDSAKIYFDRSINIKRKYHTVEILSLAESLFFKAELMDDLNMLSTAEEIYREIQNIYEDNLEDNNMLLGRLYSSMSTCLRDQFDFKNALDYAERAVQILRQDSINNLNRLAVATFFYANIYTRQDEYESSIPIYLELLNLIQNHDNLDRFLYFVYSNLATSYTNSHQFDNAQHCLNAFYSTITKDGSIIPYNEAFYFLLCGEKCLLSNQLDDARKYLFTANNIYRRDVTYDTFNYSLCNELIGDLYHKLDLQDSALLYYQNALIIYMDNFVNQDIYVNPETQDDPDKREIFDILYKKARAWRRYFELTDNISYLIEALNLYNRIDDLNDQARNSNLKDASLLILSDYYHNEYERAIDCAYELFQLTRDSIYLNNAFTLMEKSKSMLLFKSMALAERSKSINLPYSIKRREDSLRMLNVDYEQRIHQEGQNDSPDQELINKLETDKFQIVREIDNLKIRIAEEFPTYYQIRYDSLTKDLNDFKTYCKSNNLLGIEYFWGDSAIYQIVTNGKTADIKKLKQKAAFQSTLQNLLTQLSYGIDDTQADADYKQYNLNAYEMYRSLLGDIQGQFDNVSELLIIPDGMLAQLPFEALITSLGDTTYTDYSDLPYLIKETSIVYTYSINLLLNTKKEKNEPKKNLLAFSYSGLNVMRDDKSRSENTIELPFSARELRAIKKVMGGKKNRYLYDTKATENQFKLDAPEFQILHLAIHGVADTKDGDNSRLIFKQGNDTIDDSNLYMYELYGMDLSSSQLAVLSACETGIGKEFRGEGVFSMARGFTYAGCPSIIMSLWPVGDVHSASIMEEFYHFLKKGNNATEALRSSKLDFIKKQEEFLAHPANWASFVYLGEEFNYQAGANLVLILSIGIFLVVILFLYLKFFRSLF